MIPVYQPYFGGREKEYVNQCMDSTWISSKGEFIGRFEAAFAKYVGAPGATSVCNGTVALHLALAALGIGAGDEVIVPTFTYIASVNTILQAGAVPVFVDSVRETWQVDPQDIQRKITPRTKAVMAVHLYGQCCDMDPIVRICEENNLLLIEDCAEAFGSHYHGQHVGTFGDAATFSFFGNKTITTGEGGMVLAKDKSVLDKACHLKNQGVSPVREYWHDIVAYNYRMTNLCAAIGLAQIEQAEGIIAQKRQLAAWYAQALQGLPLEMHREQPGTTHSFWMCSLLVHDAAHRDGLRKYLQERGVETRPVFYPAHTMPHCKADGAFPVAEYLGARGINLPSFPALPQDSVQEIAGHVRTFFETVVG